MSQAIRNSLEFWAAERPDAPAIIEDGAVLTFAAWNRAADDLAEGLARRGVGADDIIITRLQIRAEWPIVAAAAGKLGCSLLVLNWRLTAAETRYVLANSRAQVLICDDPDPAALAPALDGMDLKLVVSVDAPAPGFVPYAALAVAGAPARFSRGEAPLIVYTSGTTGLPKGVPMSRGRGDPVQLAEYARSVGESRPMVAGEVVLVTLPMHHGAGPATVRQTMAGGNTMVLLRRFEPEAALALIERHRVTFWTGVPTMFKRIASLPPEILARYDVSSITSLGVGAAPVAPSLKTWIIGHFGDRLHEGYGATEVGMISALTPEMHRRKPGSSGLLHRHVDVAIRDEAGADLPAGETGEIWVRTPVTIGAYLNAGPLAADILDADGFFRVGDVGRVDDEGFIFITDRAKDMIISGGVNIYPAEIEAALMRHPAVQDVAVIGIPDEEFGEQVKAFVELKPGHAAEPAQIIAHCADVLASYKRPRTLDIVAELPRNTMGKLLKRELREPYWAGRERKV